MSDKDINIHVRAKDTAETKRQIDETTSSMYDLWKATGEGAKQAGDGTEKATEKLGFMGRTLESLKRQALGFISGFVGLAAVVTLVNELANGLKRVQELQKATYEKGLDYSELGQRLAFQAGAPGKQQYFAEQIAGIQRAGLIADKQTAYQLLSSADTTYKSLGGIKNPKILSLANELAPTIGAAGMSQGEIKSLFELAEKVKIAPTAEAYKKLMAEAKTAADISKTTMGEFITGFEGATAGYLAKGGTLETAMSTYSALRSVTGSEEAAASIFKLVVKLSEGGNKKFTGKIERKLGVQWEKLNEDQQLDSFLRYLNTLPQSEVTQILAEQGVQGAGKIGLLATPEAQQVFKTTQQKITVSNTEELNQQTKAYRDSMLGKKIAIKTKYAEKAVQEAPEFATWQEKKDEIQNQFEEAQKHGKDSLLINDKIEASVMMLKQEAEDIKQYMKTVPKGSKQWKEAQELLSDVQSDIGTTSGFIAQGLAEIPSNPPFVENVTQRYYNRLEGIKAEPNQVVINNNYGDTINPAVGAIDVNRHDPNAR
ncbi:MAG: hypothetical protein NTW93_04110 [Phycisphaerae bacterium]|nr:hypothetical protein [Phycisphaerae bacterium]